MCHLVLWFPKKSSRSTSSSYSLPCVPLVQAAEPGRRVFRNLCVKRCGPQTVRSKHCVLMRIDKKKLKIQNIDSSVTAGWNKHRSRSSPSCYCSFVPTSGTRKSQKIWEKNKQNRNKTKNMYRHEWRCVFVCVCLGVCWREEDPAWIACTLHPQKISSATGASLPCCDGRKKRVSIATRESA